MNGNYSSQFIYKPPEVEGEIPPKLPIRYLTDKFVINLRKSEEYCADCEAISHYATLQNINFKDGNTDFSECLEKLRDALCFVLENVDWPTNDGEK